MLSLVHMAREGVLRGYIWQLSPAGYDYEVEIVTFDGEPVEKLRILESFETAKDLLEKHMKPLEGFNDV